MGRRRITCPESAHLEEVDLEHTPFGLVVVECSRFSPPCAVSCGGECAHRLDMRARLEADDSEERVLVAFADGARTRAIAEPLAAELSRDGLRVELADADAGPLPPPDDYDAIVIGSPVYGDRHSRAIRDYIREHRNSLAQMPSFFYFVNKTGTADAQRLERDTGWRPRRATGFPHPPWRVRWFGDPGAARDERVRELARAIGDEIPLCASL